MKTLIRNFSHTFRRFFTASILNLAGLSIAFTACFVILTQVDYDYNYNKCFPAHERIYRVEVNRGGEYDWQFWLARPFCELLGAASPHIQAISVTSLLSYTNDFEIDEHIYSEPWLTGFGDYLEVFQPTMVVVRRLHLMNLAKLLFLRPWPVVFLVLQMRLAKLFT